MKTIPMTKIMLLIMLVLLSGVPFSISSDPVWARGQATDRFEIDFPYAGIQFKLKGTALLKYLVFMKAYSGALYLPDNADVGQILDTVPKRLTLEYHVAIKASDMAEATTAMIRKNMSDVRLSTQRGSKRASFMDAANTVCAGAMSL